MNDYEKVEKFAADVATLLGITFVKQFDDEMNNPTNYDEDDQTKSIYYTVVDPKHNLSNEMNCPLDLGISVEGGFQFFHDSQPLSTSLNTEDEERMMIQALIKCPSPIEKLTPEVYENFIQRHKESIFQGE